MLSKVFMICDAYEAGYGKGQQLRDAPNPFLDAECSEAWQIGFDLGSQRAQESYQQIQATLDKYK